MYLTLIRHTSVDVPSGVCYGQTDVDVASTFTSEAQQVLSALQEQKFDAVYSSPSIRCLKLAKFCGYHNPIIETKLMELNFGNWEMKKWDDIDDPGLQNWYNDWWNETPTNGESYKDMTNRIKSFLTEVLLKEYQHVAIFTHAGVIRSASIIINNTNYFDVFTDKLEYGAIKMFQIDK